MPGATFRLDGRTALITGSTRGIGGAIALASGHAGAHVIVSSGSRLDTAQDAAALGTEVPAVTGIACDVAVPSAQSSLVDAAINAYALAKAGVAQLARNLAAERGPRAVRVNAVAPGFIRTKLSRPLLENAQFMARRMQMTPLRRPGEVEEVAGAALFLATGHNLVVDGGTLITDGS